MSKFPNVKTSFSCLGDTGANTDKTEEIPSDNEEAWVGKRSGKSLRF